MSRYTLKINNMSYEAELHELSADRARVEVNGEIYEVELIEIGRRPNAGVLQKTPGAKASEPMTGAPTSSKQISAPGGAITAPLPGLILKLEIKEGQSVEAGQLLLTMEAMKMENQISAAHNGIVRRIFVSEGDSVGEGDPLVEISRPEMTTL